MPHEEDNGLPVVLVVEDSKTILHEISRQLKEKGFRILMASSLAEGREFADEYREQIFVAILDINLPDAPNGQMIDYARMLEIPCIVFTSNLDEEIREKILARNIIDYMVKDSYGVQALVEQADRLRTNKDIKVLVVDDSLSFRGLMRTQLEMQMFQVMEAGDGVEALEVYSRNPDISLAIVDYEMPRMDGLELIRTLRQKSTRVDLAIIGVSARSNAPLSAWFIKYGANDFLHKPFSEEELNCRVAHNVETLNMVRALRKLDEDKTKFLGIVAHDLRNPINGINGFVELLLAETPGPLTDDQKELLQIVEQASGNMLGMVNDLLDITVIQSGRLDLRRKEFDLGTLIQERVRIQSFAANSKNMNIELELQELPPIVADPERIAQLVDNLISNAVKYSPLGSTITVSLSREDDNVRVGVKDQGPGISEKDQKRLFQSFERTNAIPTGDESSVGLGLMIVKNIVDSHRGRAWIESELGKGAQFNFTLPMQPPAGEKS